MGPHGQNTLTMISVLKPMECKILKKKFCYKHLNYIILFGLKINF